MKKPKILIADDDRSITDGLGAILSDDVKAAIAKAYDATFEFLFTQLAVGNTAAAVKDHVKAVRLHRPMPGTAGYENVAAAPDDNDLSD